MQNEKMQNEDSLIKEITLTFCFIVSVIVGAVTFDRYDSRRVELDKHYANQGYIQLYGETKEAVMVQASAAEF